jgi:AcrR family transcriptional regulator
MKNPRIDVGSIRREQIVEAAIAIIAEQGLQHLSLTAIEQKAGMSRGQLTYYFPTKEAILLAVFDRLLQETYRQLGEPAGDACQDGGGWERVQHLLERLLERPPVNPEFHALQYTFLSQIGHRADFRRRLATLYEEWRDHMARDLAENLAPAPGVAPVSPRALATFVQALLHGLAMQAAADPDAFQPEEMLNLCLDVISRYRGGKASASPNDGKRPAKKHTTANGALRG